MDLQSLIWGQILNRIKDRLPPPPVNPLGGLDNPPVLPPAPIESVPPWTLRLGSNRATLALPANQGANFEGYLNYSFNPFSPNTMGIKGGGLRYRYEF